MKLLLTKLYTCLKCGYIASIYLGTCINNLKCKKCHADKWSKLTTTER